MFPVLRRPFAGLAFVRLVVVLLVAAVVPLYAQDRAALGTAGAETSALPVAPVSQMLPRLTLRLQRTADRQAALTQYLQDVQTPGSGSYRQWVTPAGFAQRFAPPASTAEAARHWLAAQGFRVGTVSADGMRIAFGGSVLQVNRSFETTVRADAAAHAVPGAMSVPAALAGVVSGVSGWSLQADGDDAVSALAEAVETNTTPVVLLPTGGTADGGMADLLQQAAAQGVTVLASAPDASLVDAASLVGGSAPVPVGSAGERPWWQQASGLPAGGLRAVPDALVADAAALVSGLQTTVAKSGRVGNLAASLYALRVGHGIFTHADPDAAAGTWTATDGLGTMNTAALLHALAVGTQGSNVALTTSNTTITHGGTLTLTFTVTGGSGVPSGTVTATLRGRSTGGVVTLGPTTLLANGTQTLTTATLPGDTYDVSGTYSGDSTYNTNTSNTVTVTVNPEAATVSATAPASTAVGGTIPVTVTVTSASGVGSPSGVVTVYPYGTSVSSSTYTATLPATSGTSASVVVNVPATDAGTFTFQVNCTSNGSFSCNSPQPFQVTVGKATPTVTLTAPAASAAAGNTSYVLSVVVAAPAGSSSSVAAPSGSVQVLDNGTALTTIALSKGAGTYTATLTGGAHSLTAVYSGDASYVTATSAAVAVSSAAITTTTTITTAVTQTAAGTTVPLTASVTPATYAASGAPTGTITFTSSLQGLIGTAPLANGFVTFNATTLVSGTHVITASYTPDNTTYAASTTTTGVTVTVTGATGKVATTTTLTVVPAAPTVGGTVTLTAAITPVTTAGAAATMAGPTGTVSFYANTTLLGTVPVTVGSVAGATVTLTAKLPVASVVSLKAVYSGDANYAGSTSVAFPITTVRASTVVTLTSSATQINAGNTVVLTATVVAADATQTVVPTGTVTFYDTRNGVVTTLGTATLLSNGVNAAIATLSVTGLAGGTHSITAVYSGDTSYLGATSNAVSLNFGDFSLSFSPQSLTLVRGTTGAVTATLSFSGGFAGTVALACVPPAASQITCSFYPTTLNGSGQAILSVGTTAPVAHLALPRRQTFGTGTALGGSAALAGLLGLVLPRRRRQVGAVLLLLLAVVLTSGGCSLGIVDSTQNSNSGTTGPVTGGAGSSGNATPYGTYALTITAASADTTLRKTYSYQVTVQ